MSLPGPAVKGAEQQEFRLFIDGSVAELIWNKKHAITTRIYRKPNGPCPLRQSIRSGEICSLTHVADAAGFERPHHYIDSGRLMDSAERLAFLPPR